MLFLLHTLVKLGLLVTFDNFLHSFAIHIYKFLKWRLFNEKWSLSKDAQAYVKKIRKNQ